MNKLLIFNKIKRAIVMMKLKIQTIVAEMMKKRLVLKVLLFMDLLVKVALEKFI